MAQEKLLFPLGAILVLLFGVLSNAMAAEPLIAVEEELKSLHQPISAEDRAFFQGLATKSRLLVAQGIKEQYAQLRKMQGLDEDMEDGAVDQDLEQSTVALKIFVSSSMSPSLLKTYVDQARQYGGSLIFKGLIDDSWTKTRELVFAIAGDGEPASILIDDEQFEQFSVTSVPVIVLAAEDTIADAGDENPLPKLFDRVVGNIGIRAALELFKANGSLALEAQNLLGGGK